MMPSWTWQIYVVSAFCGALGSCHLAKKATNISVHVKNIEGKPVLGANVLLDGKLVGETNLFGELQIKESINRDIAHKFKITKEDDHFYFAPYKESARIQGDFHKINAVLYSVPKPAFKKHFAQASDFLPIKKILPDKDHVSKPPLIASLTGLLDSKSLNDDAQQFSKEIPLTFHLQESSHPIENGRISLIKGRQVFHGSTNARGRYTFSLTSGESAPWTAVIEVDGYKPMLLSQVDVTQKNIRLLLREGEGSIYRLVSQGSSNLSNALVKDSEGGLLSIDENGFFEVSSNRKKTISVVHVPTKSKFSFELKQSSPWEQNQIHLPGNILDQHDKISFHVPKILGADVNDLGVNLSSKEVQDFLKHKTGISPAIKEPFSLLSKQGIYFLPIIRFLKSEKKIALSCLVFEEGSLVHTSNEVMLASDDQKSVLLKGLASVLKSSYEDYFSVGYVVGIQNKGLEILAPEDFSKTGDMISFLNFGDHLDLSSLKFKVENAGSSRVKMKRLSGQFRNEDFQKIWGRSFRLKSLEVPERVDDVLKEISIADSLDHLDPVILQAQKKFQEKNLVGAIKDLENHSDEDSVQMRRIALRGNYHYLNGNSSLALADQYRILEKAVQLNAKRLVNVTTANIMRIQVEHLPLIPGNLEGLNRLSELSAQLETLSGGSSDVGSQMDIVLGYSEYLAHLKKAFLEQDKDQAEKLLRDDALNLKIQKSSLNLSEKETWILLLSQSKSDVTSLF